MGMAANMAASGYAPRRTDLPVVISEARVRHLVRRLATAICADHSEGDTLVIVAVLKAAVVFLADLIRHLTMPLEIELVNARSYSGTRRREAVEILDDVSKLELSGRHVLLLDCVLDSGHTLAAVLGAIVAQAPASVKTCVLLRKRRPRTVDIEPEYVGTEIPDVFVVGYGLDCDNRWRHLPFVAELPEAAASGGGEE